MTWTDKSFGGSPKRATQVRATGGKCAEAGRGSQDEQIAVSQPGERVHPEICKSTEGKLPWRTFFKVGYCEPNRACREGQRTKAGRGMTGTSKEIPTGRRLLDRLIRSGRRALFLGNPGGIHIFCTQLFGRVFLGRKVFRGLCLIGLQGWRL